MGRKLSLAAFGLLAIAAVYGFLHERLLAQMIWAPEGRERFLIYAAVYWVVALIARRWIVPVAGALVLIYTMWWSGPVAPLAVLYLLGSCYFLGRIIARRADAPTATLLGLAAWMFTIWIALHFPVNTRWVYVVAFALPYLRGAGGRFSPPAVEKKQQWPSVALLLFFLLANWLLALKPEASDDGLSMHLALPMAVAHNARWAFDFHQYTWALMPAGGDCIFTAAYLLGGETAARLTNFAVLALIAALIVRFSPARGFLIAALFVSTPLVELVTGSLFVENVWAAMVVGASLALARYAKSGEPFELRTTGILFGAALAVKLIAAAFLAPAAAIAIYFALRHKHFRPLAWATLLLAMLAAPPYLYAWARSGNPVFPFANTLFRSRYIDAAADFTDPRFTKRLSWRAPYDLTFRSSTYFEGQAGSAGFQYFLLLIPAALVLRRKDAWMLLAIGGGAALILLAVTPNLRYLYPALALFSIAIGEWPLPAAGLVALAALNAWFLAAPSWYHKEFALFTQPQVDEYLNRSAPERKLIGYLNRTAPGQPVAFFSFDGIAGLNAPAYTDSWHSNEYWSRLRAATSTAQMAAVLRERGIRHIIAPLSLQAPFPMFEAFLHEWTQPAGLTSGVLGLFSLREVPLPPPQVVSPLPPGAFDDLDRRIQYTGNWIHDPQWSEAANGSITYSAKGGDSLHFFFTGSAITYVFTEAMNRGIAVVKIDGTERARIDMYAPRTVWRTGREFDASGPGPHTFEVQVSGRKNPDSSGTFVDLDQVVIR